MKTRDAIRREAIERIAEAATVQALTFATVSSDAWRFERERLSMVLSIPELRAARLDEYRRTVARPAEAASRRTAMPFFGKK